MPIFLLINNDGENEETAAWGGYTRRSQQIGVTYRLCRGGRHMAGRGLPSDRAYTNTCINLPILILILPQKGPNYINNSLGRAIALLVPKKLFPRFNLLRSEVRFRFVQLLTARPGSGDLNRKGLAIEAAGTSMPGSRLHFPVG